MNTKMLEQNVSPSAKQEILKELLVLHFPGLSEEVKDVVYRETVKYIADHLAAGRTYEFKDNPGLLRHIKEQRISTVVSTCEMPLETALLLKGLGVVQISIGKNDELVEVSDIIIDPMILNSKQYLVGTRYLLPSILTKLPAEKIARAIRMDGRQLFEEISHNDAEGEILDIVRLYQKLEWDSEFFGFNVGYISCLRLTPNIERHIKKFIRRSKIDMVEYLCNCHDRESVETSEKNGYSFVDMRLTFEQFLDRPFSVAVRSGYTLRKAQEEDIDPLKQIAKDIYQYSRYYFDSNFDRQKVVDFYRSWVEKAVRGQFDDFAFILCEEDIPVGFCTIKKLRKNAVSIGLFGLSSQIKGAGLGGYLLNLSLEQLRQEGIEYVEVVTQGRNYEAQRLYQRCGFVTRSTELWYHKWFH